MEGDRRRIFLSHAKEDSRSAREVCARLDAAQGLECWTFLKNEGGERWDEELGRHLDAADVVVVLLSVHAVASDNVRSELNIAREGKKHIVPLRLDDVRVPTAIKFLIGLVQEIDARRGVSSRLDQIETLCRELANAPSAVPRPARGSRLLHFLLAMLLVALGVTLPLYYSVGKPDARTAGTEAKILAKKAPHAFVRFTSSMSGVRLDWTFQPAGKGGEQLAPDANVWEVVAAGCSSVTVTASKPDFAQVSITRPLAEDEITTVEIPSLTPLFADVEIGELVPADAEIDVLEVRQAHFVRRGAGVRISRIPPGRRRVRVQRDGYHEAVVEFDLVAGQTARGDRVVLAARSGSIRARSETRGVTLTLRGGSLGTTLTKTLDEEDATGEWLVEDVAPGDYVVQAQRRGFERGPEIRAKVGPGRPVVVQVPALVRRTGRLVVHGVDPGGSILFHDVVHRRTTQSGDIDVRVATGRGFACACDADGKALSEFEMNVPEDGPDVELDWSRLTTAVPIDLEWGGGLRHVRLDGVGTAPQVGEVVLDFAKASKSFESSKEARRLFEDSFRTQGLPSSASWPERRVFLRPGRYRVSFQWVTPPKDAERGRAIDFTVDPNRGCMPRRLPRMGLDEWEPLAAVVDDGHVQRRTAEQIVSEFRGLADARRAAVVARAAALRLVRADTSSADFGRTLTQAVNGADPDRTASLFELRTVLRDGP
jgi:hypothetical protein